MRLPEKQEFYNDITTEYGADIKYEENIVKYLDKIVYINQIACDHWQCPYYLCFFRI